MLPFPRRTAPAVLLAVAPLIVVPGLYEATALPQSLYVRTAALAVALAAVASGPRRELRIPRLALPLAAFLAWAAASLLWAENTCEALGILAAWTTAAVVFGLAAQTTGTSRVRALLVAAAGSAVLVASIGIVQYLWGFSWIPQVARPAATFSNKNLAAEVVVLLFPLSLALLRTARRAPLHLVCGAALALQALYLFYSFSRIAWLAAALQVFLFAAYSVRHRREIPPLQPTQRAALAGAAVFVLAMVSCGPRRASTGENVEDLWAGTLAGLEGQGWDGWMADRPLDPRVRSRRSVSIRLAIWRNTLAMIPDAPVCGVGLGNHQVQYPAYALAVVPDPAIGAFDIDHVHNEYLRIAAELGLVGAGLFAWSAAALAGLCRRRLRAADDDHARWTTLALVLGLAGAAVLAAGGFPFDDAIPPPLMLLYMGLLAAEDGGRTVRLEGTRRRLALVALAAALAASVYGAGRQIAADRHAFQMATAAARGDWARSADEGRRAYAANPCRVKVLFGTGWAHLQRGEPQEAARTFEVVVAAYPYHMNAIGNLGFAYLEAGDLARAESAFERVLGIKPDDVRTHYHLARLRERQGRWDEARSEWRLWRRLSGLPPDPRLDGTPAGP